MNTADRVLLLKPLLFWIVAVCSYAYEMETRRSIAQDDKIETVKKTLFSASEVSTWSLGSRFCFSYNYIVIELG